MKFPFSSQYHLLEKLSMCYHFAATISEAANLHAMLSGVCSLMSRGYFLYINLFHTELRKACSCFCPSGYLLIENVTNGRTTAKIAYLEKENESLHIRQWIISKLFLALHTLHSMVNL